VARRTADTEWQEARMNGVAKQFWSEVYDLRTPVEGDSRRSRTSRGKKKAVRKSRTTSDDKRAA
jgi:hypothetical protein